MERSCSDSVEITNQTFSALEELNVAMSYHADWLKDLIRGLLCHEPARPENLAPDAHHRCRFGRWYDGAGRHWFKDEPLFADLDERHQAMHDAARQLLQQHQPGTPVDPAAYERFMELAISFQMEARQFQYTLLQRVCAVDQLTGAGNRYAMFHRLIEEKERAGRTEHPCVIALMDMDHFKQINDVYGHIAGDIVLKSVAQYLTRSLRKYDSIFRYGGEEFLICLPDTALKTAEKRLEQLREGLAELTIPIGAAMPLRLTASFGLGYLRPGFPIQDSIQHVDDALRKAKEAGRNRIEIAH
ncbi:MAG: diguanylate cyclase [Pseudomonadota bacterium]